MMGKRLAYWKTETMLLSLATVELQSSDLVDVKSHPEASAHFSKGGAQVSTKVLFPDCWPELPL